jgi:hypothetical protein
MTRSGFAGFRFPPEVIMVAVRWFLLGEGGQRGVHHDPHAER